jgi:DNA-binding PadR family transcriptional regulator
MGALKQWAEQRRRRDEAACASGYPISRLAGIGVGRAYPALARMEADGRVTSEWESPQPFLNEFRPRRRLYRVTGSQLVEAGR